VISEDILYLSVRELGERLRAGQLSPVALTEAYLDRSSKLGPRLNSYAMLLRELALRQARQAEQEIRAGKVRGPLHGIPYAAKDLLAVAGYPTTWGARPLAHQTFPHDATVITRLRDAGAILLGKAAMIELAGGLGYRYASASLTGPAKNPWKETCWTCGSSSGSGAIVSAALAAFAIGSETWGSIICPSAFCGISGFRPTYGRVSRHGAMALAFSMDKLGPMARSAEDCALILAAIAGHDPQDPSSLSNAAFHDTPPPKGLRIGWLTNAWKKVGSELETCLKQARDVLAAKGATIEEAQLPEGPWEPAANLTVSVEGAAAFQNLIESGQVAQLTDPLGKVSGYVNQQVPAADYVRAQRIRGVLQQKMNSQFDRFDVLATASEPVPACALSANLETELDFPDPLGGIGNLCGLPCLSVPCGFTKDRLPLGLQFVGRAMDDHKVLAAGRLFQILTDWHRQRPPVQV
jgi:aspartyl-tRNA(Asn)/glutamyl-tRNA(Gln) amidotransferase subunit A